MQDWSIYSEEETLELMSEINTNETAEMKRWVEFYHNQPHVMGGVTSLKS